MYAPKTKSKPGKEAAAKSQHRASLSQLLGIPVDALIPPERRKLQELIDVYPDHMRLSEPQRDSIEFTAGDLYFAITLHQDAESGHWWFVPLAKNLSTPDDFLYIGNPHSSPMLALRQLRASMTVIVNIYESSGIADVIPEVPEVVITRNDPKAPTFEI